MEHLKYQKYSTLLEENSQDLEEVRAAALYFKKESEEFFKQVMAYDEAAQGRTSALYSSLSPAYHAALKTEQLQTLARDAAYHGDPLIYAMAQTALEARKELDAVKEAVNELLKWSQKADGCAGEYQRAEDKLLALLAQKP